MSGAKRPALFVDCGAKAGVVLKLFQGGLPDFALEGFEVQEVLARKAQKSCPTAYIRNSAVWIEDSSVMIFLPDTWGVNYRGGAKISHAGRESHGTHVDVPSIDFVRYLRAQRDHYKFVAVKFDIEGAEYPIIRNLYADYIRNTETLIDYLICEFHPQELADPAEDSLVRDMLTQMGIKYELWI